MATIPRDQDRGISASKSVRITGEKDGARSHQLRMTRSDPPDEKDEVVLVSGA